MARYYIKQQVFSWRKRFYITDSQERDCYYVEGEIYTLGRKLRIFTLDDQEAVYIEQKLFKLTPEFDLFVGDRQVATIKKHLQLFRNDYDIYGLNWSVDGDFLAHDYVIREQGKVIADIRKKFFAWGGTYEINVADENQAELLLAVVIVIDCVLSSSGGSSSGSSSN